MYVQMKELLRKYDDHKKYLKKYHDLIESKWKKIIESYDITPITIGIYENGPNGNLNLFETELKFIVCTDKMIPEDIIQAIENESSCKLENTEKRMSHADYIAGGSGEKFYYIFKALKIVSSPVEDSWLKD